MNITNQLKIIPRADHIITRANISPSALKVLYRLSEAGFAAYLVGGSVRDLLLGHVPKDFDVATDAHPEQIKKLFRNCILIGRRFRLAHIRFGHEIIEVATFRGEHGDKATDEAQRIGNLIIRDNVYGTLEEDALRRDFTINSLYYNIADFSVVDYCGGMQDLQSKKIRMIGDPFIRYQEDPVRLLRAVRFAAKLGFTISSSSAALIKEMGYLLHQVSPARLFEESLKLLMKGHAEATFALLQEYELFQQIFPASAACMQHQSAWPVLNLIRLGMRNSDLRLSQQKTLTPAFMLALLLWYPLLQDIENEKKQGLPDHLAQENAIRHTLKHQLQIMTIPKRFTQGMIDIWRLQFRLQKRLRRTVFKILSHPRFRAAYDFLLLRAEAGEEVSFLANWWTAFHDANEEARAAMQKKLRK